MTPALVVTIIIAALLIFLALLMVVGLWLARRFSRGAPNSQLSKKLGPWDIIPLGFLVIAMTVGLAVRTLAPQSTLGSFLSTPLSLALAFLGLMLAHIAISVVIALARHYIFTRRSRS